MQTGFDNALYMQKQTEQIKARINEYHNKLYLEFGGKLFDDFHAARVLPGFEADAKIKLLLEFSDMAEILFCVNADDIANNRIRADIGISYDQDVLRLMDKMRSMGLYLSGVVITRYKEQPAASIFKRMLEMRGESVYLHYPIEGYPTNIDHIVSDQGFGLNDYVKTTRPLVIVTAPGPCSGKLALCLSQLYHEYKRGIKAGYAKFETFPIWNLPLKHPVNLAYEAATADLRDINMIDPYHFDAYGKLTVNYNRDVKVYPIVRTMLEKITGDENIYRSPTDMGVNMAGYGIVDDEVVRAAAKQEIIRRYYRSRCDYKLGRIDAETAHKIELLMKELDLMPSDRRVVAPAIAKSVQRNAPAMAIELDDGRVVTGRGSDLMSASASAVLNSLKELAGIDHDLYLLAPVILEPIVHLKKNVFGIDKPTLDLEEVLIALSICAVTNTIAALVSTKFDELRGCEAHSSHILPQADMNILGQIGINVTCEADYPSDDLYNL